MTEAGVVRQSFLGEVLHLVTRKIQHVDTMGKIVRRTSEAQHLLQLSSPEPPRTKPHNNNNNINPCSVKTYERLITEAKHN
ncbi:hypothetical protein INR49_027688 [Caranx melampygus]|nr:hypothetical protein INR49_027688 [Caranx melampygus]